MTRQRAEEVMLQLQHLLVQTSTGFNRVQAPPATMALTQALGTMQVQANAFYGGGPRVLVSAYAPIAVSQAATEVRQRATELKEKAATASEKAIIEIVALMFQSILDEDRIPPSVRVWFARLQVPGLRVALAEPEFFHKADHPARKLIDRMGSCVLGFDANAINGSTLERKSAAWSRWWSSTRRPAARCFRSSTTSSRNSWRHPWRRRRRPHPRSSASPSRWSRRRR